MRDSAFCKSAFDTESGEWLIVAAPVFQEVLGGEDDGKKVWTGFVFHAGTLLRALTDIRLTAASYCTQSNPTPQVTIQGKYRGHRVSLKVLMEPLASQPVVEIIDTIKFEIRKITSRGGIPVGRRKTATDLASAWRGEKLEFNDAIIEHLLTNLAMEPDLSLILGIGMAVSYVNMGQPEVLVEIHDRQMPAGEVVREFAWPRSSNQSTSQRGNVSQETDVLPPG